MFREVVPRIDGEVDFAAAFQRTMQSCILRMLHQEVSYLEPHIPDSGVRPRHAHHDAHGVENAIAIAHGVDDHATAGHVIPDHVFVLRFHVDNCASTFIKVADCASTLIKVATRDARRPMVRIVDRTMINDSVHLGTPCGLVYRHLGKYSVGVGFDLAKRLGPWCVVLNDVHTTRADPKMHPHPSFERQQ